MLVPLVQSSTILQPDVFWNAVSLYYNQPHVVNRKLAAATPSVLCQLNLPMDMNIQDIFRREAILYEYRKLQNHREVDLNFIKNLTEDLLPPIKIIKTTWDCFRSNVSGIFVALRILISRRGNERCIELTVFNKKDRMASFHTVQEQSQKLMAPPFPYHLVLSENGALQIILDNFENADTPSAEWISDKLFPKLLKFGEPINEGVSTIKSLSLIEPSDYCETYNNLKLKYGEELVAQWPKYEKTDPQKFVFEDFAIASYLITFWSSKQDNDIKFIDAGCGNGLLVYLLNKEGYKGYGVDLRRRRIWDYLDSDGDMLKEGSVLPESRFPDCNWIIGNHSDELSPWIPVLALKSSPTTNFFLLPCCSYDFSGQKYIRTNSKLSQYGDYLNYIQSVSCKCGFTTQIDKLRIPSTKRTCLIGQRDVLLKFDRVLAQVNYFIESKMKSSFTVKNPIEDVRNCTKLDRVLITRIINLVVLKLLGTDNFISHWNMGGRLNFAEISHLIPREDLLNLKREHGGLQTLIKNHRYIFKIENGFVSIRKPLTGAETEKYRDKPCWFFLHHPNGCLYDKDTCASKHDQ